MHNVTPLFSQATSDEFYSLREGQTLARVEMNGDVLSQIIVTDGQSEGVNNRVYIPIIKGRAQPLTREEYTARRALMMKPVLCH